MAQNVEETVRIGIELDEKQIKTAMEQIKKIISGDDKTMAALSESWGKKVSELVKAHGLQANGTGESPKFETDGWDAYLKKYGDAQERILVLTIEYAKKIEDARAAGKTGDVATYQNDYMAALFKEGEFYVNLFKDASDKSVAEILRISQAAEDLFNYLSKTDMGDITPLFGFSAETLKGLKASPELLKAISGQFKTLYDEGVKKNPFATLAENIKDIFTAGEPYDKAGEKLKKLGESATASADKIGSLAGSLSKMFAAAGNKDLAGAMETVQGVMSSVSNIGKGFAQGGVIGGIGAIVGEAAGWIGKAMQAESRHKEALKAIQKEQLAQQRQHNLLLLQQNLLYEKGNTIFGKDRYGAARNAVLNYHNTVKELNKELAGTEKQQKAFQPKRIFGLLFPGNEFKEQNAGLASIQIKTGHKKTGLFGWGKGKDTYSSVLDVYPELIDAEGNLDIAMAKTIISTRTMGEEAKASFQTMINYAEQAVAAQEKMKDYLTDIFGSLGDSMSSAMVDAFKNGSDAAKVFTDSVSGMLESLAEQMVYSVTLAPIFEAAQENMLDVMNDVDLSEEEKFQRYADILSGVTKKAVKKQEEANRLYSAFQQSAAAEGFEIFKPDEKPEEAPKPRTSASQGFAQASQESIDVLSGVFANIENHTFGISEMMRTNQEIQQANAGEILGHLSAIHRNTDRLEQIEGHLLTANNRLDDVVDSVNHLNGR